MKTALDMRAIVALIIMFLFGVGYAGTLFIVVPQQNHDTYEQFQGALLTAFAAAWGYFLGTSRSSTEKDATISALASGNPSQPQPGPTQGT